MSKSHIDKKIYQNNNLTKLFSYLKNKKIDGYITSLSNCHLYEYVDDEDNTIQYLTDFTGDTASLLIRKNKAFLIIDGRFIAQSKKEIRDKRIQVIFINSGYNIYNATHDIFCENDKIYIDFKIHSIDKIVKIKNRLKNKIKLIQMPKDLIKKEIKKEKTSREEFVALEKKYSIFTSVEKINKFQNEVYQKLHNKNFIYITDNLEEIAYLTNVRSKSNKTALFKSFLILYKNKWILYTDKKFNSEIKQHIADNKFYIKSYSDFDKDLNNINDIVADKITNVLIDYKKTNYYIYKILKKYKNLNVLDNYASPLYNIMSTRTKAEINNLIKANIDDGVSMCRLLYTLKTIKFDREQQTEFLIKQLTNGFRYRSKTFLQPSFETIVAYKQNSAICHYQPTEKKSRLIRDNSILLIDSGGNYMNGTTDVTRTVSMYKKNKNIPKDIIKNYTLVLKSLISLTTQKFPYGYTGRDLDIIARANLYNEYLDYEHGTGHGIGNVTNVHFGPNTFSPGVDPRDKNNILKLYQVQSVEPGVYFINKYGIRLENDTYVKFYKSNRYGDFYGFETLTLCPFDKSLISKQMLTKKEIDFINNYHKKVYDKLHIYFEGDILKWLEDATSKI